VRQFRQLVLLVLVFVDQGLKGLRAAETVDSAFSFFLSDKRMVLVCITEGNN